MTTDDPDLGANIALQEVNNIVSTGTLLASQYIPWLIKWEAHYSSFDLPPLFGQEGDFHSMYWHLDQLRTYLSFTAEAEEALSVYSKIKDNDEKEILHWLTKHEHMHKELGLFIYNTMCANLDENVSIIDTGKVKISATDFLPLIKFCNVYDPLYFEKLEKYSTYTPEEEAKLDMNGEEGDQYLSLTFQLMKSGLLPS